MYIYIIYILHWLLCHTYEQVISHKEPRKETARHASCLCCNTTGECRNLLNISREIEKFLEKCQQFPLLSYYKGVPKRECRKKFLETLNISREIEKFFR